MTEPDAIAGRRIAAVIAGAIAVTLLSLAVTGVVLHDLSPLTEDPAPPKRAPIQISGIHQTLIERHAHGWDDREAQRHSLDGYHWVDREHGVVQIPIERAMQLYVERAKRRPP